MGMLMRRHRAFLETQVILPSPDDTKNVVVEQKIEESTPPASAESAVVETPTGDTVVAEATVEEATVDLPKNKRK